MRVRSYNEISGFTLLEILLAIAILAILISVFIPMFVGARSKAVGAGSSTYARHCADKAALLSIDQPDLDLSSLDCEDDLAAGIKPSYLLEATVGASGNDIRYKYSFASQIVTAVIPLSMR